MVVELQVIVETTPSVGGLETGERAFESPDVIEVTACLLRGLRDSAPAGCAVVAHASADEQPSVAGVLSKSLGRTRADIGQQWQWGLHANQPQGLVHSASLLAPLTKHDRIEDRHQVVVTVWDLRPWLDPRPLPKAWVEWQRAMLKRAVRHADAFVVPSHALAAALTQIAPVRDRVRVLRVGASDVFVPRSIHVEPDALAVVVFDAPDSTSAAVKAALENDLDVVVIDCNSASALEEAMQAAHLDQSRVQILPRSSAEERASLLSRAAVLVNTSDAAVWPWRVAEALQVGVPIVSLPSVNVADVVGDAALFAELPQLGETIAAATGTQARRLSVLAQDASNGLNWRTTGEQIWALHADL